MPRVISESDFSAFIDGKVKRNAHHKSYGRNGTSPLACCKNDIVTMTVVPGGRVSAHGLHAYTHKGADSGDAGAPAGERRLPPRVCAKRNLKLPQIGGKHHSDRGCFATQASAYRPYKHLLGFNSLGTAVSRAPLNHLPTANIRMGLHRNVARDGPSSGDKPEDRERVCPTFLPHTSANHLSRTCLRRAEALLRF